MFCDGSTDTHYTHLQFQLCFFQQYFNQKGFQFTADWFCFNLKSFTSVLTWVSTSVLTWQKFSQSRSLKQCPSPINTVLDYEK